MTSLSTNLFASAERYPNNVALRCDDLQFTFAQFDAAAARVATLLEQAGIEPGDRVGVMLPNTPAFAIAFYGIIYRGAVAVPMNPLLKAREVAFYLSNSDPTEMAQLLKLLFVAAVSIIASLTPSALRRGIARSISTRSATRSTRG